MSGGRKAASGVPMALLTVVALAVGRVFMRQCRVVSGLVGLSRIYDGVL
jgi:hypothetical protein